MVSRGGPAGCVFGVAIAMALAAACAPDAPGRGGRVLVMAAASLQNALDELLVPASAAAGVPVDVAYAASSSIARQVESGAPAGVVISADLDWMDYLAARRLVDPSSRVTLLGNRLVLVATAPAPRAGPAARAPDAPAPPPIGGVFPLAERLGSGNRLAIADPAAVPAGKYARAALESLGLWTGVADRLAAAENVRAALLLVARGEAPLGIVYRTDLLIEPGVVLVGEFPESAHPPIVYPAGVVPGAPDAARRVLAFLQSAEARAVFERHGFSVPDPSS